MRYSTLAPPKDLAYIFDCVGWGVKLYSLSLTSKSVL